MKYFLLFFLFLLFSFFEGVFTTIPLVLDLVLLFYVLRRDTIIFPLALVSGLLLDFFSLRTIGISSLFLIIFLLILKIYERKFEIFTNYFILFFSFFGSFCFLIFFGYKNIFFQAVFSSLISYICFIIFNEIKKLQDNLGYQNEKS